MSAVLYPQWLVQWQTHSLLLNKYLITKRKHGNYHHNQYLQLSDTLLEVIYDSFNPHNSNMRQIHKCYAVFTDEETEMERKNAQGYIVIGIYSQFSWFILVCHMASWGEESWHWIYELSVTISIVQISKLKLSELKSFTQGLKCVKW